MEETPPVRTGENAKKLRLAWTGKRKNDIIFLVSQISFLFCNSVFVPEKAMEWG